MRKVSVFFAAACCLIQFSTGDLFAAQLSEAETKELCGSYAEAVGAVCGAAWTARCDIESYEKVLAKATAARNQAKRKLHQEDFDACLKPISAKQCTDGVMIAGLGKQTPEQFFTMQAKDGFYELCVKDAGYNP